MCSKKPCQKGTPKTLGEYHYINYNCSTDSGNLLVNKWSHFLKLGLFKAFKNRLGVGQIEKINLEGKEKMGGKES